MVLPSPAPPVQNPVQFPAQLPLDPRYTPWYKIDYNNVDAPDPQAIFDHDLDRLADSPYILLCLERETEDDELVLDRWAFWYRDEGKFLPGLGRFVTNKIGPITKKEAERQMEILRRHAERKGLQKI